MPYLGLAITAHTSCARSPVQAERSDPYCHDPFEASQTDSFLDVSLVSRRDTQVYLLAMQDSKLATDVHARADEAFTTNMAGIDLALEPAHQTPVGVCWRILRGFLLFR